MKIDHMVKNYGHTIRRINVNVIRRTLPGPHPTNSQNLTKVETNSYKFAFSGIRMYALIYERPKRRLLKKLGFTRKYITSEQHI